MPEWIYPAYFVPMAAIMIVCLICLTVCVLEVRAGDTSLRKWIKVWFPGLVLSPVWPLIAPVALLVLLREAYKMGYGPRED